MGIFSKISHLFQKNKAHRQLLEAYAEVHQLASALPKILIRLRSIQKKLVGQRKSGGIGLQKTLYVEEELVHLLQDLAQKAEHRFYQAMEQEQQQQPTSPLEQEELARIIRFLKKVQEEIPKLKELETKNKEEKLLAVESALRDTAELAREFYVVERYEKDLVRRVLQSELSPLLRRIYQHPDAKRYSEEGKVKYVYTATLTMKQLRKLEREAKKLNAAHDPQYGVIWRRWWRDLQIFEQDATTPLKDPHINVTIKIGGKKKDVHLLLAA